MQQAGDSVGSTWSTLPNACSVCIFSVRILGQDMCVAGFSISAVCVWRVCVGGFISAQRVGTGCVRRGDDLHGVCPACARSGQPVASCVFVVSAFPVQSEPGTLLAIRMRQVGSGPRLSSARDSLSAASDWGWGHSAGCRARARRTRYAQAGAPNARAPRLQPSARSITAAVGALLDAAAGLGLYPQGRTALLAGGRLGEDAWAREYRWRPGRSGLGASERMVPGLSPSPQAARSLAGVAPPDPRLGQPSPSPQRREREGEEGGR